MTASTRGRPRVLFVDYSLGFGGAIKSLALTLRALPADAFVITSQDPEICRTWVGNHPVRSFRRVVNYRNLNRVRAAVDSRVGKGLIYRAINKLLAAADLTVTAKNLILFYAFLRRHRIQLVHLNNGFLPAEAILAARFASIPCVVHQRDFFSGERPGSNGGISHVIAISNAVATSVEELAGVGRGSITIVHDPVDLEKVTAALTSRDRRRREMGFADEVAVGIFGRVIQWKGQKEFVRAMLMAMRDVPGLRGVVVGDQSDGGPDYFAEVRSLIDSSPFRDRFVLTGYTEDVEEYYAAMDIVVHASITPEPFGMVVPEAMAAGKAVIATDAGGPREVITNGVDGLLVPIDDCDAMADAILTLARDPRLREEMGARARRTVSERFQIMHNVGGVAAVHRRLVAG